MSVDHAAIVAVLFAEARLLDEQRFAEWLELFTSDATYWVPAGGPDPDPKRHVSIIHDDRMRMGLRVERITGGRAFAQEPRSETVRAVSNIEISANGSDEAVARSVLTLGELRGGRQQLMMARCLHRLRREGTWRITRKEVHLLHRGEVIDNLTMIV